MTLLPQQGRHVLWRMCLAVALGGLLIPAVDPAIAQYPQDWDAAGAYYVRTPPDDPITQLQTRIDQGRVTLSFDAHRGYLPAVLKALKIPVASQMLVFSKTSVHRELISGQAPRSLYFNDSTYIGWVPNAPVLEVASVDPHLGAVYYVLLQKETAKPKFFRNTESCLECHNGSVGSHVPGHLMRSVYTDGEGAPLPKSRVFDTTDAGPYSRRWGGWYVTGKLAGLSHMGNCTARQQGSGFVLDRATASTTGNLRGVLDTSPYLTPHSDVVALMVMGHQTHLQNLISRANYVSRMLLSREKADAGPNSALDSARSPRAAGIEESCEPLVKALLFSGEAPLPAPIAGSSGFAEQFATGGKRDKKHRSLRDLDLHRRLMRYPCSYTIYSDAFEALPAAAKDYIYLRLWEILSGRDRGKAFAHLSGADRKAVSAILRQTKQGFVAWLNKNRQDY